MQDVIVKIEVKLCIFFPFKRSVFRGGLKQQTTGCFSKIIIGRCDSFCINHIFRISIYSVDLKKELKKRGLEEKGKKAILFARLKEAVDAEVTPEPEVAPVVVVATNPSSKTNTSIKKEETTTKESSQETTKETSSSSTSSSSTDATTPIPIPISSSTTMQSILTDLFEKGTAPTYVPNLTATEAKKERKLKEVQAFRQYQEPLIESWKLLKYFIEEK